MSYELKPVDDKIERYLKSADGTVKVRTIANSIDYHRGYVGRRCKRMAEAGRIERHEGGYVIGHDISGRDSPTILSDDRDHLLSIIREEAPERLPEAQGKSVKELRKLIKREVADATYPLGTRSVSYSADG
jgi:predicted transcriptional regulator